MSAPETSPNQEQRADTSPAMACANKLVWRASVLLLAGMGAVLILVWDRSLSLGIIGATGSLWFLTAGFIYYFFRDPEPNVPTAPNVFLAPAHGLVDVVEEASSVEFMGERCRRISIFLSIFDIHVQYAPAAGRVLMLERQAGRFVSALNRRSAHHNESVLIGIECSRRAGERVAARQVAGVIARRIITWVNLRDVLQPGQRLGVIQFGSRCDLHLPMSARIKVRPGDRVVGGETVIGVAAGGSSDEIEPWPGDAGGHQDSGAPGEPSPESLKNPP